MNILIIEDELKTADYLRQGFREAGFVVNVAHNGVEGLHLGLDVPHDVVILDVMLPGMNGWQVLRQWLLDFPTLTLSFKCFCHFNGPKNPMIFSSFVSSDEREEHDVHTFWQFVAIRFDHTPRKPCHAVMNIHLTGANDLCS